MIVEYIRYTVPRDKSDALVAAYVVAGTSLQASQHCRSFELTRCTESVGSFVLRVVSDSLAGHLQGFRSSAEFRSFFQAVQAFVAQIDEMRHYELTTVNWERES